MHEKFLEGYTWKCFIVIALGSAEGLGGKTYSLLYAFEFFHLVFLNLKSR